MNFLSSKEKQKHPLPFSIIFTAFLFAFLCVGASIFFIPGILTEKQTANQSGSQIILLQETTEAIPETPGIERSNFASVLPEKTPDPLEDRITSSNYSTLQKNDNYPSVGSLQQRLMELGYLESDEPGSVFNESTEEAVILFQRASGLPKTGIADSDLQEILFSSSAIPYEVKMGDNGKDISDLQEHLTELGYYTGKQNGYFGTATEDALIQFQAKNKLTQNGKYSTETRDLLMSDTAKPFIDPTPEPTKNNKETKETSSQASTKPKKTKEPSAVKKEEYIPDIIVIQDSESKKTGVDNIPVITEASTEAVFPTGGTFQASGDISGIISCAEAQIGKKYVSGDEGPDTFDCSGLVYYCLTQNGIRIGRRSAASYSANDSWKYISSMDDLQRGDLLFFKNNTSEKVSHTGIYIGGGMMIDASSSSGKVVKRSTKTDYWMRNFVCARRIF